VAGRERLSEKGREERENGKENGRKGRFLDREREKERVIGRGGR
jgi:hypothetical protein